MYMVESFWAVVQSEIDKSVTEEQLYQQAIGSLVFLALSAEFDIPRAVSILFGLRKSESVLYHLSPRRQACPSVSSLHIWS